MLQVVRSSHPMALNDSRRGSFNDSSKCFFRDRATSSLISVALLLVPLFLAEDWVTSEVETHFLCLLKGGVTGDAPAAVAATITSVTSSFKATMANHSTSSGVFDSPPYQQAQLWVVHASGQWQWATWQLQHL